MGFFDSLKKEMNNMMNEQQKSFENALRRYSDEWGQLKKLKEMEYVTIGIELVAMKLEEEVYK